MLAFVIATLHADGCSTALAHDGDQLLDLIRNALDDPRLHPDVVVVDVKMPGLSGLGVLAALRRMTSTLPVVLMTVMNDTSSTRSQSASAPWACCTSRSTPTTPDRRSQRQLHPGSARPVTPPRRSPRLRSASSPTRVCAWSARRRMPPSVSTRPPSMILRTPSSRPPAPAPTRWSPGRARSRTFSRLPLPPTRRRPRPSRGSGCCRTRPSGGARRRRRDLADRTREHAAGLAVERDETDHDLSQERARSDRAVATRDEFLGVVSHDLTNMLSAMVGFARSS